MKIANRLTILASAALVLGWAVQAKAQYQAVGDDGIAASPKLRQILSERKANRFAMGAGEFADYPSGNSDQIAASPKLRETLNEEAPAVTAETGGKVPGYRPVGEDGIAASPKLRQMLDERRQTVQ